MAATAMSLCFSNRPPWMMQMAVKNHGIKPVIQHRSLSRSIIHRRSRHHVGRRSGLSSHRFAVFATTEGSAKSNKSDEQIPSWARPDSDEPPPWARDEGDKSTSQSSVKIPFFVYLLASAITAIAAVLFRPFSSPYILSHPVSKPVISITDWFGV